MSECQRVSQSPPESAPERAREGARVRQSEPERATESQKVSQSERESELVGLKGSLRVTLGPNLGCQSQPRQSEVENIDFS